jgi:hypothetical protein
MVLFSCLIMSLKLDDTTIGPGLEFGLCVESLFGLLVEGHQVRQVGRLRPANWFYQSCRTTWEEAARLAVQLVG